MHQPHPEFQEPEDPRTPIWHYTAYAAYLQILRTRRLHFTRLDKLRDPYEGRFVESDHLASLPSEARERIRALLKPDRAQMAVNCWCTGDGESVSFWERYASPYGVAIKSSVERLRAALAADSAVVHLGKALYVADPRPRPGETLNGFRYVMRKLPAYEDEREIRAVIWSMGTNPEGHQAHPGALDDPWPEEGWDVSVDLDALIEEVWVGPPWQRWFYENVKAMMAALGCDATRVRRSLLMDPP